MRPATGEVGVRKEIYDPVKAHAYYLRTRQLKGRHSGLAVAKLGVKRAKVTAVSKRQQQEALHKAAEVKVKQIKQHLAMLEKQLKLLTKDQKSRAAFLQSLGLKVPENDQRAAEMVDKELGRMKGELKSAVRQARLTTPKKPTHHHARKKATSHHKTRKSSSSKTNPAQNQALKLLTSMAEKNADKK